MLFFRIDWFFNSNPLKIHRGIAMSVEGILEIESISESHEGFYHCTATNRYGKAMSRMAHLQMGGTLEPHRCRDANFGVAVTF